MKAPLPVPTQTKLPTRSDPRLAPPRDTASARARALRLTLGLGIAALPVTQGLAQETRIVRNVEVRGAEFIPADQIQMTCGAEVGIAYSDYDLRAIEDCLLSTDAFETVALSREAQTLVITVQELNTRPGRIEASIGYVSQDGPTARVSFERYNLFPKTYGSVSLDYNSEIQSLSAALYHTEIFDTQFDLGIDLILGQAEYDDRSYSQNLFQIEPYLAWTPRPDLRLEAALGVRDQEIFDVDPDASALLRAEDSDAITAAYLRFGVEHAGGDLAPDGDRPRSQGGGARFGYRVTLNQYIWNIGTPDALSDTRLSAASQVPLSPDIRFLAGLKAGTVHGIDGNATRALDRTYLGADRFRGFAPRGLGPVDSGDYLGGNSYVVASFEVQRDFGQTWKTPMRGGLFIDTGAAWGLDDTLGGEIDDAFHLRSSVGASLTFDVQQTPVSLYVAHPFQKEVTDDAQILGLSIGLSF
ncbi:BamA/TamA family outer membrane protein [Albirhodobacter sp. R86504]|uniref:BamA/TamA family outer membrane protein n=1 Tax=Albirhodobacter sp. R86504 TaxID=3093848 RepID=UPI00366F37FB